MKRQRFQNCSTLLMSPISWQTKSDHLNVPLQYVHFPHFWSFSCNFVFQSISHRTYETETPNKKNPSNNPLFSGNNKKIASFIMSQANQLLEAITANTCILIQLFISKKTCITHRSHHNFGHTQILGTRNIKHFWNPFCLIMLKL